MAAEFRLLAVVLLSCWLWPGQAVHAQARPDVHELTVRDGLPSNTVYDLHFDAEGWLWVATDVGLYRYDGVDFQAFTNASARHTQTHKIVSDSLGNLYVQNFRRQLFQVRGDSLHLIIDLGLRRAEFASYLLSPTRAIAQLGDTLYTYIRSLKEARAAAPYALKSATPFFPLDRLVTAGEGRALLVRSASVLGLTTLEGPLRVERTQRLFDYEFEALLEEEGGSSQVLVGNFDDDDPVLFVLGNLWDSVVHVDRQFEHPIPGAKFRCVRMLSDQQWLFGTDRGLLHYNFERQQVSTWIRAADISNLAYAPDSMLWVSTLDRGLVAIPHRAPLHYTYPNLPSEIADLARSGDGRILAATQGFKLYALGEDATELYQSQGGLLLWTGSDSTVHFGHQLSIGPSGLLSSFDELTSIKLGQVKTVVELPKGRLLIGDLRHLLLGHRQAAGDYVVEYLRPGRTVDLSYDPRHGVAWAACADSLLAVVDTLLTPVHHPLLSTAPTAVKAWGDQLLIGTSGAGLLQAPLPSADSVAQLGLGLRQVGSFSGREVRSIAANARWAWVVSDEGLNRCAIEDDSTRRLTCELLGPSYGLPRGAPTAVLPEGDSIHLAYTSAGGAKTLYTIASDQPRLRPQGWARPYLVNATIGGGRVQLSLKQPVQLEANTTPFAFEFRVPKIDVTNPQAYRFRLEGRDSSWRYTGAPHAEVYFASLPPGTHRLHYALADARAPVYTLSIEASVPLWKRPWVFALAVVALVVWVAYLHLRRVRRRANRLQLEAEVRRSKLSAISAQMNPHFMFNALNSIQEFIVDHDPKRAIRYLGRFARLMRLTLDHSQRDLVRLQDDIKAMRLYVELEQLRHDHRVEATFEVMDGLPGGAGIPPLLAQPFIENVFKHAFNHPLPNRSPQLQIRYGLQAAQLLIEIIDNGTGRSGSQAAHRGYALQAATHRFSLLDQQVAGAACLDILDRLDEYGAACGTHVRIRAQMSLKWSDPQATQSQAAHA